MVWFSYFIERNINLRGLFNTKAILLKEQLWYYSTQSCGDNGGHTFPWGISPNVNAIERLEFELAYNDVIVCLVSHHAMETLSLF